MVSEQTKHRSPLFQGLLPVDRAGVPAEVLAGVTLAALAIPEVMGYATIDFSGAETLRQVHGALADHDIRFVVTDTLTSVRAELDRYGIVELLGADAFFDTLSDTVAAFRHTTPSP